MTNKSLLTDSAVPSTHMPFSSDVKNDSSCFSFGSDPDPFPELSATCRGHDDALPADRALAAEDVIVTERPGWKEAYFQATRGVSQSVSQSVATRFVPLTIVSPLKFWVCFFLVSLFASISCWSSCCSRRGITASTSGAVTYSEATGAPPTPSPRPSRPPPPTAAAARSRGPEGGGGGSGPSFGG